MTDDRPPMTRTLRALYEQIEQTPGDLTLCGAVADALDDLGYAKLPHAYRWMMTKERWPHLRRHYTGHGRTPLPRRRVPVKFRWAWYADPRSPYFVNVDEVWPQVLRVNHQLPDELITGSQQLFATHSAAVHYLANRLQILKDVYDLAPARAGV